MMTSMDCGKMNMASRQSSVAPGGGWAGRRNIILTASTQMSGCNDSALGREDGALGGDGTLGGEDVTLG